MTIPREKKVRRRKSKVVVASDRNHVPALPLSKQQALTSPSIVKVGAGKCQWIMAFSPSSSIATSPQEQQDVAKAVALSLKDLEEGPVAGPSGVW